MLTHDAYQSTADDYQTWSRVCVDTSIFSQRTGRVDVSGRAFGGTLFLLRPTATRTSSHYYANVFPSLHELQKSSGVPTICAAVKRPGQQL